MADTPQDQDGNPTLLGPEAAPRRPGPASDAQPRPGTPAPGASGGTKVTFMQRTAPLAQAVRPTAPEEIFGQAAALRPGSPLDQVLKRDAGHSLLLWGPPGSGKTTLATMIAARTDRAFVELSAISAGVRDVREAIAAARRRAEYEDRGTVLFIDEVHRFNATQQDALLQAVEHRWVSLIGATTENPSLAVASALMSRMLLVTLEPLDVPALEAVLDRALAHPAGLAGRVCLAPEARERLVHLAGGDARRALTLLEAAAEAASSATPVEPDGSPARAEHAAEGDDTASTSPEPPTITVAAVDAAALAAAVAHDRAGTAHYDTISAWIKSVRGSDVDAALHYLARMMRGGEDPRYIARRLVVLAAEDIGLADPAALQIATAAASAAATLGWPEARIPLAEAVVYCALAPKSNAVIRAIDAAIADIDAGRGRQIPLHLRDAHGRAGRLIGAGIGYAYPHDDPAGVVAQQYIPDDLRDAVYYRPGPRGAEARLAPTAELLRSRVRG